MSYEIANVAVTAHCNPSRSKNVRCDSSKLVPKSEVIAGILAEHSYNAPEKSGEQVQQNMCSMNTDTETAKPLQTEKQSCSAAVTSRLIELPSFWKQDPRLWFAHVEFVFRNYNITSDTTKFDHVVIQLPYEVLKSVSDIVLAPPDEGKYEALKKGLMQVYDEGDEKRLQRLLRDEKMGNEKPSMFMHRLRYLANGHCMDTVIRFLFLEQLPVQARAILAVSDTTDLSCLASMADRVMDVLAPSVDCVEASDSANGMLPHSSVYLADLESAINSLRLQVEKLTEAFDKRCSYCRGQSESRRQQAKGEAHNSGSSKDGLCSYHKRFGTRARNCNQPCSWKQHTSSMEN